MWMKGYSDIESLILSFEFEILEIALKPGVPLQSHYRFIVEENFSEVIQELLNSVNVMHICQTIHSQFQVWIKEKGFVRF